MGMPSKDYKKEMERYKKAFFENKKISKKNKGLVTKYMISKSNEVSPARMALIYRFLPSFLEKTKDLKKDMKSRDKMSVIFFKIKRDVSPSVYNSIINVSKTLCRYYNDEETPKGFRGIKTNSKGDKRKLKPSDMVTWDDGLLLAKFHNDIQFRAVITTQLDGGFRPSEFIDLTYGDVTIKDEIISVYVRDGKTGPRTVQLYKAGPFLNLWLAEHPIKKKNSPLWVQRVGDEWVKYNYHALDVRMRRLGKMAKLDKPLDFYNLRHSACVLAKKDNLPTDLASAKFGHSVKFYTETYGRLSVDDAINRMKKHYGLAEEEIDEKKNQKCPKCSLINLSDLTHCSKCNSPLTLGQAIKEREGSLKLGKKMEIMEKSMEDIKENITQELTNRIWKKLKGKQVG